MRLATPFKGAHPYLEEDAHWFFGRDAEIELVCDIFRASKLTVLFGAQGAGKTSLLNAGVVPHLKRTAAEPERVIVFDSWNGNPVTGFTNALRHASRERVPHFLALDSIVKTITRHEKLLIGLDRFEECLLRHKEFAADLARLIGQSDDAMHFLLLVRDEAEPAMQSLQAKLPQLFEGTLRLRPLTHDAARSSVVGPIEVFNFRNPGLEMRIEPAAVETMLEAAKDEAPVENGAQIDAAKLQRIASALWEYEFGSGMDTMRLSTLNKLLAEDEIAQAPGDDEILDDVRPPSLLKSEETPAIAQAADPDIEKPAVAQPVALDKEAPAARAQMAAPKQVRERRSTRTPIYASLAVVLAAAAILYLQNDTEPQVALEGRTNVESSLPVTAVPPVSPIAPAPALPSAPDPEVPSADRSVQGSSGDRMDAADSRNSAAPVKPAPSQPLASTPETKDRTGGRAVQDARKQVSRNDVVEAPPPPAETVPSRPKPALPKNLASRVEPAPSAKSVPAEASVFIHVRDDSPATLQLVKELEENGIAVSGVKKVDRGPSIVDLRYFHPGEKQEANEIAKRLKKFDIQIAEIKYIGGYEDTAKGRQYELWFPPGESR